MRRLLFCKNFKKLRFINKVKELKFLGAIQGSSPHYALTNPKAHKSVDSHQAVSLTVFCVVWTF
jgi:hypothetical protein